MHTLILSAEKPKLKLLWLTDLHLDAAAQDLLPSFFQLIEESRPQGFLIGGDISNGIRSLEIIKTLQSNLNIPLYFVFGNHDYYGHSIEEVRTLAKSSFSRHPNIHYLTFEGPIPLTDETVLIGHDGWADGVAGNFLNSTIYLNDYLHIKELKELSKKNRLKALTRLGKESADKVEGDLKEALKKYQNILLLTHAPPFREACCYKGKKCDDNWAPHFVCQEMGNMLLRVMKEQKAARLTVLCGHAHFGVDVEILPNLRAVCGHSVLGIPSIQGEVYV